MVEHQQSAYGARERVRMRRRGGCVDGKVDERCLTADAEKRLKLVLEELISTLQT